MARIITFISLYFLAHAGNSQSEENQIRKCIQTMFEGMAKFDSAKVRSLFDKNFSLKTIVTTPDGKTSVREQSGQDFLNAIGNRKPDITLDERLTSIDIKTDGNLAMAWTPYRFYLNSAFSHCGVNVFIMAKIDNDWKITFITDTRRKSDCVP